MKNTVRILALLLTLLMILPLAIACKKEEASAVEETTVPTSVETSGEKYDANGYLMDYIPDDVDYEGIEVSILGWSDEPYGLDFYDGDMTGNKISDAAYTRNMNVQDRLNVTFVYKLIPGSNPVKGEFVATVTTSITSGEAAYDVIGGYSMCAPSLAVNNMLADMSQNQNLHFDAPWWNETVQKGCLIGNSIYFCSGDIASSSILEAMAMQVNTKMIQNAQLEDPRELVENGEWTLEKLFEYTKGVYKDSDGNTVESENDTYGIVLSGQPAIDAFLVGSDISYISKTRDGKYTLSEQFDSEKTFDLMNLLINKMYKSNDISEFYNGTAEFKDQKAMFNIITIGEVNKNKGEVAFKYTLIPLPKHDVDQKSYKTVVGFPFTMYCLPGNVTDIDMSCLVLECMASEAYRQLRPDLYEVIKFQGSDEAIDAKMYDIIVDGIVFDLGRVLHGVFDTAENNAWAASPVGLFRMRITNNDPGFYSAIKSNKEIINQRLQDLNNLAQAK